MRGLHIDADCSRTYATISAIAQEMAESDDADSKRQYGTDAAGGE